MKKQCFIVEVDHEKKTVVVRFTKDHSMKAADKVPTDSWVGAAGFLAGYMDLDTLFPE